MSKPLERAAEVLNEGFLPLFNFNPEEQLAQDYKRLSDEVDAGLLSAEEANDIYGQCKLVYAAYNPSK